MLVDPATAVGEPPRRSPYPPSGVMEAFWKASVPTAKQQALLAI